MDQKIKSVLIAERLEGVAKHLRIVGIQSDLVVADRRAYEAVHSIVI